MIGGQKGYPRYLKGINIKYKRIIIIMGAIQVARIRIQVKGAF
jgi:hypothetical protein